MKKIALVAAVAAAITSPAFAVSYNAIATSGTLARPGDSMSSVGVYAAGAFVKSYYVSDSAGTASDASNTNLQGAVQLIRQSDWTFDFTDLSHVAFSGNIQLGDYKVQTNTAVLSAPVDARQTFVGVTQSFSGVGTYDLATNTFTYVKPTGAANTGGASVYTQTSSSCVNGGVSPFGTLCPIISGYQDWEGLALSFVFTEPGGQFTGAVSGTDKGGSGITGHAFYYNWVVTTVPTGFVVASEVPLSSIPIPAAAWLFGSSLVGLVGLKRRQKIAL